MESFRSSLNTQDTSRNHHLIDQEISGYDNLKELLVKLEASNTNNDQIILLFTASEVKDKRGKNAEEDAISKVQRTWNTDCDIFEEVVDLIKNKVVNPSPTGWLVKVRITPEEFNDEKSPFKRDEEFAITEIPTLMVYNTMKRISGRKTFSMDNVIIMLED